MFKLTSVRLQRVLAYPNTEYMGHYLSILFNIAIYSLIIGLYSYFIAVMLTENSPLSVQESKAGNNNI